MIDKGNNCKGCKNCNVMFLRKIKKPMSTTLEIILDQLHPTKHFSQIAPSLIREPITDAVTRKNICTHTNLF